MNNRLIALITAIGIFYGSGVSASCFSDSFEQNQKCALEENDDQAQLFVAQEYLKKAPLNELEPDQLKKALLYFHLSADNGNAKAQRLLAELLIQLDEDVALRQILKNYIESVRVSYAQQKLSFSDELLHPYILLKLASEPGADKWYYSTKQIRDVPYAKEALAKYPVSDQQKKAQLLKRAVAWKQQKIKQAAQEVYDENDYKTFLENVFPQQGMVDAFMRQQALNALKEKIQLAVASSGENE